MFTFKEVMAMVTEAKAEEEKRSYENEDIVDTKRYEELFFDKEEKTLRSNAAKIFKCNECGEMVGYWDLEDWCCHFSEDNGYYICDCCYEEGMGDDL